MNKKYTALLLKPAGQPALQKIIPEPADRKIELCQDHIEYQNQHKIKYHRLQPGAYAEGADY